MSTLARSSARHSWAQRSWARPTRDAVCIRRSCKVLTMESTQPETAPGKLFISYASQDVAAADKLCAALEAAGLPCWIAPRDVAPGQSYAAAIVAAISDCRMLVLLLSQSAVVSPHVLREVERASSKRRPVLPVRLDDTALPPELEYFLSVNHWLDAPSGNIDRVLPAIISAIRRDPGVAAPAPAEAPRLPGGRGAAWPKVLFAVVFAGLALIFGFRDRLFPTKHVDVSAPATAVTRATSTSPVANPVPMPKSVAVLPFADLSEKKDQAYFADGLSDELIERLGRIPGLHVPARTSSFYFKGKQVTLAEIGKALNVTRVLEGSVRKSGNRLRVTAELVDVADDSQLWSQSYDRKLDDVFKVQDEIAAAVVQALQLNLLQPLATVQQTSNSEAHSHYLLGRQLLTRFGLTDAERAAAEFERATNLDPNYAAAWAGLADARFWTATGRDSVEARERDRAAARAAADRSIELQPDLPYGHLVRGVLRIDLDFDFSGGAADLERALELEPDNPDMLITYAADLLLPMGRFDAAVAMLRDAAAADPLNARVWTGLGFAYTLQDDLAAGRDALQRSLDINPLQAFVPGLMCSGYLREGKPSEALEWSKRSPVEGLRLSCATLALDALGRHAESDQLLAQLTSKYAFSAAVQVAQIYVARGDRDAAFEWLERARRQHDSGLIYVKVDPILGRLSGDQRFDKLLREINLLPPAP